MTIDPKGMQREVETNEALRRTQEARKKGLIGWIRKKSVSKKTRTRLKAQQSIKVLRKQGITIKSKQNTAARKRKKLGAIHPLLKEVAIGDIVKITNKKGIYETGELIEVVKGNLLVDIDGEVLNLKLDQLRSVTRV